MTALCVVLGVLAVIASGFLAADISDTNFYEQPESHNKGGE